MNQRRNVIRALAAAVTLAVAGPGFGQTFPSKPITFVVPFPPGGLTDQVARTIGQKLSESVRQPVIVENKPGGGGQIAAAVVKQAPADGHTLFIGDVAHFAANPFLCQKFSYDPIKDFAPITTLVTTPLVLVVPQASATNSVADVLASAKKTPAGLNYASQGIGTVGHLLAEAFKMKTGANLNHVPYKGSSPALSDLIAGRVDLLFDPVITATPFVTGSKLKALAIASPKRSSALPKVPTLDELGYSGLNLTVWFGIAARAGTPEATIRKLNEEIVKALNSPDVVKRFSEQGLETLPTTSEKFSALVKDETTRWSALVKATGAKVE